MIFGILLFLAGIYFLRHSFPLLFFRRPAQKADSIKLLAMLTALFLISSWLEQALFLVVKLYGGRYFGESLGSFPFYLILSLCVGVFVWKSKIRDNYDFTLNNSIAIVGISKRHALPALYDVLDKLGLSYRERIEGISLPDKDIDIRIDLKESEIRFHVSRSIDKLFLEALCKSYQEHYRNLKLPLANTYAVLAMLSGLSFLIIACLILLNWTIVSNFG